MKKVINVSFVFLAILAISTSIFAQGPGGPMGGGGPMMMMGGGGLMQLAGSEEAIKAIGISEKQMEDLRGIRPEGVDFGTMRDMSQEERQAAFEKMRADIEKKVNAIVTPEQMKKAQTISFQMSGGLDGWPRQEGDNRGFQINALGNEFAMSALNLTDEQKKKIAEAQTKQREEIMALFRSGGEQGPPNRETMEANRAKMQELGEATNKTIVALLTDEQKALAKKLIDEAPAFVKPENRPQPTNRGGNAGPGGPGGEGGYRPGEGSWQPGQNREGQQPRREARGAFPVE